MKSSGPGNLRLWLADSAEDHRSCDSERSGIQGDGVSSSSVFRVHLCLALILPWIFSSGRCFPDGSNDKRKTGQVRTGQSRTSKRPLHCPLLRLYGNAHQHGSSSYPYSPVPRGHCNSDSWTILGVLDWGEALRGKR